MNNIESAKTKINNQTKIPPNLCYETYHRFHSPVHSGRWPGDISPSLCRPLHCCPEENWVTNPKQIANNINYAAYGNFDVHCNFIVWFPNWPELVFLKAEWTNGVITSCWRLLKAIVILMQFLMAVVVGKLHCYCAKWSIQLKNRVVLSLFFSSRNY